METKHTPGEWEPRLKKTPKGKIFFDISMKGKSGVVAVVPSFRDDGKEATLAQMSADARLIGAAAEGLRVAMNAYASILRLPRKERLDRQFTLASLRDYIAGATGRSAEDVQNEFEAKNPIAHDDATKMFSIRIPARRQGKTALAKLQKELEGTDWNVEGESGCYEVWNEKLTPGLTLECPTIADVRGEIEAYNARAVKKS